MTLSGIELEREVINVQRDKASLPGMESIWLPDFKPARSSLAGVSILTNSRMPIERFLRLSAQMFKAAGIPETEIAKITTYSARRVLPSVADAAALTPTERIKIGAWTDSKGGKLAKEKGRLALPDRYSDHRLYTQARAKIKTIIAVRSAIKGHPNEDEASWEDLAAFLPSSKS